MSKEIIFIIAVIIVLFFIKDILKIILIICALCVVSYMVSENFGSDILSNFKFDK
jgi:hypothetical protein